jgi:flagellar biosynthesis/type III secretory pathway protein FliH
MRYKGVELRRKGLDTLRIARDLSEGNVFSHEQAERLGNAFATYWAEVRSELVTKEYLDARLAQLEAKFDTRLAQLESRLETRLAQMQNRILAAQVALFVLLGVAIHFK